MKHALILFALFLLSCQKEERPENLISKEKMASILIDIHLAEAYSDNSRLKKDTLFSFYKDLEIRSLEEHGVDSLSFFQSYDYYSTHIQELDQIYEWVVDTLNAEQAALRTTGK